MSRAKTTRIARSLRRRQKRLARTLRASQLQAEAAHAMMQAAYMMAETAKDVEMQKVLKALAVGFRGGAAVLGLDLPTWPGPEAGTFTHTHGADEEIAVVLSREEADALAAAVDGKPTP